MYYCCFPQKNCNDNISSRKNVFISGFQDTLGDLSVFYNYLKTQLWIHLFYLNCFMSLFCLKEVIYTKKIKMHCNFHYTASPLLTPLRVWCAGITYSRDKSVLCSLCVELESCTERENVKTENYNILVKLLLREDVWCFQILVSRVLFTLLLKLILHFNG